MTAGRLITRSGGERQTSLIRKIDQALARIDDGSYGFCEETGEPISLRRLEARPIATLAISAQERIRETPSGRRFRSGRRRLIGHLLPLIPSAIAI